MRGSSATSTRRCSCGTDARTGSVACSGRWRTASATTSGRSTLASWADVRIGSDTGGTFTDLVAADGSIVKVPSTPDDPGRAVAEGVEQLGRVAPLGEGRPEVLAHGTTVGTNALLERRGASVALVVNEGFRDLIEIARQDRPSLYDQSVDRP